LVDCTNVGGPRILEDFGTLNLENDDELVLVLENQDSVAVFEKQGADTSLVEAAVIASRELEVEQTGNGNDQTGSAPAPSAAAPSSGGQLEPALIHSDDDPSKEDDDKDDDILPTKDDIPRRKQHDADSDSSEE